jgi:hypothetical protein
VPARSGRAEFARSYRCHTQLAGPGSKRIHQVLKL